MNPLAAALLLLALGSCAASSLRHPVRLASTQTVGTAAIYDTTGCDSLRSIDFPDWEEIRFYVREAVPADSAGAFRYVYVITHGWLVVDTGRAATIRSAYQSCTSKLQVWIRLSHLGE
jgi:hypothetical protein